MAKPGKTSSESPIARQLGMVSILIVTWNCRNEIMTCLMSLARLKDLPIEIETLVVDNDSMDGTVEYLQENELTFKGIGLRVAYNSENVGLSRATDQAYQRARGNWILLCNPDVAFNRGFLELLRYGTSHTDAIMTTEMVHENGRAQRVVTRRFPTVTRVFFDFGYVGSFLDGKLMNHLVRRRYTYQDEKFPETVSVESPGASFLLLNRRAIENLGIIFDPRFPVWWNDVDLAKRAERAGIKRILISSVKVEHRQGHGGVLQMESETRRFSFCRSMILFARKWNMRPNLLQFLFFVDAILGLPLSTVVRQIRNRNFRVAIRKSLQDSALQIRGVISV